VNDPRVPAVDADARVLGDLGDGGVDALALAQQPGDLALATGAAVEAEQAEAEVEEADAAEDAGQEPAVEVAVDGGVVGVARIEGHDQAIADLVGRPRPGARVEHVGAAAVVGVGDVGGAVALVVEADVDDLTLGEHGAGEEALVEDDEDEGRDAEQGAEAGEDRPEELHRAIVAARAGEIKARRCARRTRDRGRAGDMSLRACAIAHARGDMS
jgi:hypothetical protein